VSNELTEEVFHRAFTKLFGYADDPPAAYEQLRQKLVQYFRSNSHSYDRESLADKVMDRLLKIAGKRYVRVEDDESAYRFASRVAYFVNLEQRRQDDKQWEFPEDLSLDLVKQDDFLEAEARRQTAERRATALEACLAQLKPKDRELLSDYYGKYHGHTKRLALELGITHETLRIRVFRLKVRLKEMVDQYLNNS